MKSSTRTRFRRHGFLTADAIFGIFILGVTLVTLLVTVSRVNLAEQRLAEGRRATAIAEATLTDLQCRSKSTQSFPDAKVTIQATPDGHRVNGLAWARVTVTVERESRTVTGLVPESALTRPTTRETVR